MKVVGLTGGIGSGKTTILSLFEKSKIPCYSSDNRAKHLMNNNITLKNELKKLLGEKAFINDRLNKRYISNIIFNDSKKLSEINRIVHRYVQKDFEIWKNNQTSSYVIKESALLFETGAYKNYDFNVLVTAPTKLRVKRVVKSRNISESEVMSRISSQWDDKKKETLADFVIVNNNWDETIKAVEKVQVIINDKFSIKQTKS